MRRLAIDRLTILLVEDDVGDATLVRAYLDEAFATPPECLAVARLDEALALLGHTVVDLILCDLSLPDAQGPEVIARLRGKITDIPIVVLTGRDDTDFSVRLIEQGVQDYLTKREISPTSLARAIRYALERHKLVTQLQSSIRREQLRRQILTRIAEDAPLADVLAELSQALVREIPCEACGFAIIAEANDRNPLLAPGGELAEAARRGLEYCLADAAGDSRGRPWAARPGETYAPPIYVQAADGIRLYSIHSGSGELLGKFTIQIARANGSEQDLANDVELSLELAALATERFRAEEVLRRSQAELRQLSGDLLNIQEAERQRISADLHDGIGQSLSIIKLGVEDASRQLAAGARDGAGEALQRLVPRVKDAIMEVRRISMDLRPSTIDDLGILPTLSWFCREFETASGGRIAIDRAIHLEEADVPARLKIVIFRVLQEAVSNIVKHAHANRIRIDLARNAETIEFCVRDNGRGFDPLRHAQGPRHEQGLGLRSMKERARFSGGNYALESAPGDGTRISISWPAAAA